MCRGNKGLQIEEMHRKSKCFYSQQVVRLLQFHFWSKQKNDLYMHFNLHHYSCQFWMSTHYSFYLFFSFTDLQCNVLDWKLYCFALRRLYMKNSILFQPATHQFSTHYQDLNQNWLNASQVWPHGLTSSILPMMH